MTMTTTTTTISVERPARVQRPFAVSLRGYSVAVYVQHDLAFPSHPNDALS